MIWLRYGYFLIMIDFNFFSWLFMFFKWKENEILDFYLGCWVVFMIELFLIWFYEFLIMIKLNYDCEVLEELKKFFCCLLFKYLRYKILFKVIF